MRNSLFRKGFLYIVLIQLLTACGGGASGSISILPSSEEFKQHTNSDVKIDILFVVDDSGSMSQEQQAVYDNFKEFISLFYDKGFDFRIAVAKTSAYGSTINCRQISTGTARTCSESGAYKYSSGGFISRENGLTPKEFRCGYGNNCGVNSEYQTEAVIAETIDEDSGESLKTTIGNGTPAEGTDHILASSKLTKIQMIAKFKKNILVGLLGSGDERGIESAETVIRNMKQFYSTENQFPRPNSHLAIIHVGDEGDGPMPNFDGTSLNGSNRSGVDPYVTSSWGSLRSMAINADPNYDQIETIANDNLVLQDHLNSTQSYFEALKKHQRTATVSVHSIEDLPNSVNLAPFLPQTAFDKCGSTSADQVTHAIGYFQSYMAYISGGLVLSKCDAFGSSLALLGDKISSLASYFTLGEKLDQTGQESLQIYVEGLNNNNPIPKSEIDGYQYDPATGKVSFYGSMIPPQGAIIGVVYTCGTFDCFPL